MSPTSTIEGAGAPKHQFRYIVGLAVPVVFAELGWMAMSVVDTIMVGPLGPAAIGAVSVGTAVFDVPAIFGIGLLLGLDTVVSQSYGAGRRRECDAWLWHGLYLAFIVAGPLMIATYLGLIGLPYFGVQHTVLEPARLYVAQLSWSLPPLLIYAAVRRYLQGISCVRPVMIALITANIVNVVGNALLIPRFGVEGAAWATVGARVYMAALLCGYAVLREPSLVRSIPRAGWHPIRQLLALGVPAAGQILLEVGVFATTTVLAGRLRPEALAAHHVVLNIAGTTFMVPLGISSAGAVVVGQAIGRGDPAGAKRSGWLAIALGAGFMTCTAAMMVLFSQPLLRVFTTNAEVLSIATPLLFAAVLFQIFDGTQVTATGVLRGAGNTKTPMYANLMAHWLLGLPAGYYLCFHSGWGVWGLWTGFCIGLTVVGIVLLAAWSRTRV